MGTQWMTKIVVPHDLAKRVHEAFQTAVHQLAVVGDVVGTVLAA